MFKIEEANRLGAKVCISLAGDSGSGKTYSAIRLARGLVGEQGKIGVIDTEQKRASLYADCFGGFNVINFEPPYSPSRYRDAIKTFKDAGYNAMVIDSMSHEWESVGGILDMVDNSKMKGLGVWKEPKAEHRKLMTAILNGGMHVIMCYRVKYEMIDAVDHNGKATKIKSSTPTIVTEPNTDYDVTVKLFMDKNTRFPTIMKCPEGIEFLFKNNQYITEQSGSKLIEWLSVKQRDKDAIIAEGQRQEDRLSWFKSLNEFEQYLAKKYSGEIKENEIKPVVEAPVIESSEPKDVEL